MCGASCSTSSTVSSDALYPDGVIVIDKPAGPTSHDVVAVLRRAILSGSRGRDKASKPKVGHTGTLDPLASGVLPLVIGKATRLAQFLSSAEKEYEAVIELGVTTTTLDRGLPHICECEWPLAPVDE